MWVFNKDKPYDRFLIEQLAGDELVDWRNAQKFTPEIRELDRYRLSEAHARISPMERSQSTP